VAGTDVAECPPCNAQHPPGPREASKSCVPYLKRLIKEGPENYLIKPVLN